MQRLAILVILAALTAACGKKQAPAGPKPPAAETKDEAKPGEGEGGAAPDSAPAKRMADPCEGGERK
jgi:hypothetical protein